MHFEIKMQADLRSEMVHATARTGCIAQPVFVVTKIRVCDILTLFKLKGDELKCISVYSNIIKKHITCSYCHTDTYPAKFRSPNSQIGRTSQFLPGYLTTISNGNS